MGHGMHGMARLPLTGDALLLDNATVQHSREDFTPPRRILASLVGALCKVGDELLAFVTRKDGRAIDFRVREVLRVNGRPPSSPHMPALIFSP